MQCVNCSFENMPGVQACGRCGASLQIAALAIDVHPPRAGAWAKRWRRWSLFGSLRRGTAIPGRGFFELGANEGPHAALLRRLVVPGWAQAYRGDTQRGGWFLAAYLACLVLGLASAGSLPGGLLLGLAFAVHAASIIDVAVAAVPERPGRLVYSFLGCAGVALMLYFPLGWLASRIAAPRQMLRDTLPFQAGDVVLVNYQVYRWRQPRPGDVVLYDVPLGRLQGQVGWYQIAIEGERIDRILASEGQNVLVQAGHVVVDGQRVADLPLNPKRMPATLNVVVPPNYFLILPTTALADRYELGTLDWHRVGLVPSGSIRGRVYLRHYPFWRFWWVR